MWPFKRKQKREPLFEVKLERAVVIPNLGDVIEIPDPKWLMRAYCGVENPMVRQYKRAALALSANMPAMSDIAIQMERTRKRRRAMMT